MKKLISVFLVFLLTFSLAFTLISCTEAEKGEKGDTGAEGPQGELGKDGETPTIEISEDGYWVINGEKTEVKAQGEKGDKGEKGDTGAQGPQGEKGEPGKDAGYENSQGLDFFLKDDGTYAVGIGNAIYLSEITIPSTYSGKPVSEIGVFCPEDVEKVMGSRLKKIIIPDSITTIGDAAFENCTSLTNVIIPDSVISIGKLAFADCDSLTSITIPDSVTTIGDSAFSWSASLTSIVIPDSVITIGDYAFGSCSSLISITVNENNTEYKDIDGNLYTKDGKTLVQYAIGKTATSFIIPEGVETIGDYAFCDCDSLNSVTIGNGVTTIGTSAFDYCNSLTSVTIGRGVTVIDRSAFSNCDSLTDVYYTGSEEEWAAIEIGDWNDALTEAIIHYNYGE